MFLAKCKILMESLSRSLLEYFMYWVEFGNFALVSLFQMLLGNVIFFRKGDFYFENTLVVKLQARLKILARL